MENIDYKTIGLVVISVLLVYYIFFVGDVAAENFIQLEHASFNEKKKDPKKKNKKSSKKKSKKKNNKKKKVKKDDKKKKSMKQKDKTMKDEHKIDSELKSTIASEEELLKAIIDKPTNNFDELMAKESNLANIKISKMWSAYPDDKINGAEIANDTDKYKQLMIVGNKSAGGVRQVGIWDQLNVNGTLRTVGQICINDTCIGENELKKLK